MGKLKVGESVGDGVGEMVGVRVCVAVRVIVGVSVMVAVVVRVGVAVSATAVGLGSRVAVADGSTGAGAQAVSARTSRKGRIFFIETDFNILNVKRCSNCDKSQTAKIDLEKWRARMPVIRNISREFCCAPIPGREQLSFRAKREIFLITT